MAYMQCDRLMTHYIGLWYIVGSSVCCRLIYGQSRSANLESVFTIRRIFIKPSYKNICFVGMNRNKNQIANVRSKVFYRYLLILGKITKNPCLLIPCMMSH